MNISFYRIAGVAALDREALAGGTTTYTRNIWCLVSNAEPTAIGIKRLRAQQLHGMHDKR